MLLKKILYCPQMNTLEQMHKTIIQREKKQATNKAWRKIWGEGEIHVGSHPISSSVLGSSEWNETNFLPTNSKHQYFSSFFSYRNTKLNTRQVQTVKALLWFRKIISVIWQKSLLISQVRINHWYVLRQHSRWKQ